MAPGLANSRHGIYLKDSSSPIRTHLTELKVSSLFRCQRGELCYQSRCAESLGLEAVSGKQTCESIRENHIATCLAASFRLDNKRVTPEAFKSITGPGIDIIAGPLYSCADDDLFRDHPQHNGQYNPVSVHRFPVKIHFTMGLGPSDKSGVVFQGFGVVCVWSPQHPPN